MEGGEGVDEGEGAGDWGCAGGGGGGGGRDGGGGGERDYQKPGRVDPDAVVGNLGVEPFWERVGRLDEEKLAVSVVDSACISEPQLDGHSLSLSLSKRQ